MKIGLSLSVATRSYVTMSLGVTGGAMGRVVGSPSEIVFTRDNWSLTQWIWVVGVDTSGSVDGVDVGTIDVTSVSRDVRFDGLTPVSGLSVTVVDSGSSGVGIVTRLDPIPEAGTLCAALGADMRRNVNGILKQSRNLQFVTHFLFFVPAILSHF